MKISTQKKTNIFHLNVEFTKTSNVQTKKSKQKSVSGEKKIAQTVSPEERTVSVKRARGFTRFGLV